MSVTNVLFNVGYCLTEEQLAAKPNVDEKYLQERQFYSCNQTNDFIKYVDSGIDAGDVIGYTNNKEKSSGIFDQNGGLNKKERSKLRDNLRKTKSVIWHTVISFTEDFGARFMKSSEDAQELLQAELPRFFKQIGMPEDNIVWFAGLHENTDNQHIHLSFFEKEPMFYSARDKTKPHYRYGKIAPSALNDFIIHVEERLTDASFDLKRSRRELMSAGSETLLGINGYLGFNNQLKRKLLELYRALPTDGRVSYNGLNMVSLRPQIRGIVDFIIKNNAKTKECMTEFGKDLVRRDSSVKEMCARQNISDPLPYLVEDKYLEDVYRRLGDKVIKAAMTIKNNEEKERQKCKNNLAKKRVERRHRQCLFDKGTKLAAEIDDDAIRIFEEYRRKLSIAEYERLIEEGVIEQE